MRRSPHSCRLHEFVEGRRDHHLKLSSAMSDGPRGRSMTAMNLRGGGAHLVSEVSTVYLYRLYKYTVSPSESTASRCFLNAHRVDHHRLCDLRQREETPLDAIGLEHESLSAPFNHLPRSPFSRRPRSVVDRDQFITPSTTYVPTNAYC